MMPNLDTELGSTMISSISMLARPALITRVGEPGSDRADGGDDSDGDEVYCFCCISLVRPPLPAIHSTKDPCCFSVATTFSFSLSYVWVANN